MQNQVFMKEVLSAVRVYLAKLPPAISGAGGHNATFRAACSLMRFGLNDSEAIALLREWNGTHCQPPWTEKELLHKLRDARRATHYTFRPATQPKAVRISRKI